MSGGRDVAVVIVNYRTAELTAEAARSALSQPEAAEVVVVDNASGDGSGAYLRTELSECLPPIELVESDRNLGFGGGCEVGVRHSSAPLLFFLNSDAILLPGSLRHLRGALLEDCRLGVVAPLVYRSDGQTLQVSHGVFPSLRNIVTRMNLAPPDSLSPDWVSGVAMLLRRSDYLQVGGFDPAFVMYLEDVDLCRRVRAAGKQIRLVPQAAVRHVGGASRRSAADQRRQYHRSQRLYFEKSGAGRLTLAGVRLAALLRRVPTEPPPPRPLSD